MGMKSLCVPETRAEPSIPALTGQGQRKEEPHPGGRAGPDGKANTSGQVRKGCSSFSHVCHILGTICGSLHVISLDPKGKQGRCHYFHLYWWRTQGLRICHLLKDTWLEPSYLRFGAHGCIKVCSNSMISPWPSSEWTGKAKSRWRKPGGWWEESGAG